MVIGPGYKRKYEKVPRKKTRREPVDKSKIDPDIRGGKYGYRAGRRKKEREAPKPSPAPAKRIVPKGRQPSWKTKSAGKPTVWTKITPDKPVPEKGSVLTPYEIKTKVEAQRESFYQEALAREQAREAAPESPQSWMDRILGYKGRLAKGTVGEKLGVISSIGIGGGTAGIGVRGLMRGYATNPKSTAQTISWVTKLAAIMKKPAVIGSLIVGAIGSYPFSGFLKEEALQTLSFGIHSAIKNEDWEGAERALDMQAEILDPSFVREIIDAIPYQNIVRSVADFFNSARVKHAIDTKVVADLREQQETGMTDAEAFLKSVEERLEMERIANDRRNADNLIANQARLDANAAAAAARDDVEKGIWIEQSDFWKAHQIEMNKLAEEERKAVAAFWLAYYKEKLRLQRASREEMGYSRLSWGLL